LNDGPSRPTANRSVNSHARHRNFHLFLDHKDSQNMALDATFYEEPAQKPID
jgi:hypothetical protein